MSDRSHFRSRRLSCSDFRSFFDRNLSSLPIIPEASVLDLNEHRLSRWQMVQQITESFWKSWFGNYLHTLQQLSKCLATGQSRPNRSHA